MSSSVSFIIPLVIFVLFSHLHLVFLSSSSLALACPLLTVVRHYAVPLSLSEAILCVIDSGSPVCPRVMGSMAGHVVSAKQATNGDGTEKGLEAPTSTKRLC
ncbi:hypothetical protein DPEC_G00323560 [Dallia pectoralis]|uniref:Uncharacterized protein n=1 Tax=Dallia pectoralis TaxID=75939 RepID=A0ACC2FAS2_DALPE|nr:hypothetical protein DPEC_G00323560 [Dallia pectoralis]